MKPKDIITLIGFLLVFGGAILGIYKFNEDRYAQCSALQTVEMRLDLKIEGDVLNSMRDRLWTLEEKCAYSCSPQEKKEIQGLKEEIETQKEKLREIQKQMYKGKG